MENMTKPVAVSSLREAGKIRAVIYASNQLAHVPLAEILKLAVQTEQGASAAAADKKQVKAAMAAKGHFIRLGSALLLQYGFQAASAGGSGRFDIRFPLNFADSAYYPFFSLCGKTGEAVPATFIAAETRTKTGFSVHSALFAEAKAASDEASAALAACAPGVFWLAIGCAAKEDKQGEGDDGSLSFS